jgi:hypothetical protein
LTSFIWILSIRKICNAWPFQRSSAGIEAGQLLKSRRETVLKETAIFLSFNGLPAGLSAGVHYSSFTAAVEKIPLSMVHVNRKPQHLVFCSHSRSPLPKPGHSACGKLKRRCRTRVSGPCIAPIPVQDSALATALNLLRA